MIGAAASGGGEGSARVGVAVLPREVAARVISGGVARGAWAISAISLLLTVPMLCDIMLSRGLGAALPVPVLILVVLAAGAVLGALRPTAEVAAGFLLVGSVGAVAYEVLLLDADPALLPDALFVLNRPAVSLVLVGVQAASTLVAASWTVIGFLISTGVSFAVAGLTGGPVVTGWGPALMLLLYIASYAVLAVIQARLRRVVPDFAALDEQTGRLAVEEELRAHLTASMHDTLLNDLALVLNGPDELDERVVSRLRADVARFTGDEWRRAAGVVVDDQDVELRNRITAMIGDLQWRGLTVRVTGSGPAVYRLDPEVAEALLDAAAAALENVLRHAGTPVAELDLAYDDDRITVLVSDEGVGFERDQVAGDRLGLRGSIERRLLAVGGSVRVWSSPGAGTSVIMSVPILERVGSTEVDDAQR
jgi:hypothetical protein